MYNEKIKQAYIDYKKSQTVLPSVNYLQNIFNKFEDKENELGMDLNSFPTKEIINCYKMFGYTSLQRLKNENSALTQYVEWCMENNIIEDNQNHFAELSGNQILSTCLNAQANKQRIVTRQQVLEICNAGFVYNAMDKFILLGLFEGLQGKNYCELADAKSTDFDHGKLIYHASDGNDFHITETLYAYAQEAWESTEYYGNKRAYEFKPSNYCIKTYMKSLNDTPSAVRMRIWKRLDKIFSNVETSDGVVYSDFMTGNSLYESGMIDYLKGKIEESCETFHNYLYSEQFEKDMKFRHYMWQDKKFFYTKYSIYLE